MVTLTRHMWDGSADIYDQIVEHPFLAELADGTLSRQSFRHYLVQDSLYLRSYSHALTTLAAASPDPAVSAMFAEHADNAIAAEAMLHADLLAGLEPSPPVSAEPSPTTLAYTSYLLATVRAGSFAQGVAAVLPCYWIYCAVGRVLAAGSSPDPVYARWIDTYGGADFGRITERVLDVVDDLEVHVGSFEADRMRHHYRVGARYEWMFWNAAYHREGWPV